MANTGKYLRPSRGVPRSNTRKKRGYTLIILISSAVVAGAVALVIWFYGVMTAPDQFTPQKLVLKGQAFSDASQIQEIVNSTIGTNMLLADLNTVCNEVERVPWVLSATARKIIPDTLEISLTEQRPAAFALVSGSIYLVDHQGSFIEPLRPELPFDNLPVITGLDKFGEEMRASQVRRAVEILVEISRRAVWQQRVQEIHVAVVGSERLHLAGAPAPVIIGSEDVDRRLTKYLLVEAALRERFDAVEYIDLRFSNQVVVNGSGN